MGSLLAKLYYRLTHGDMLREARYIETISIYRGVKITALCILR